MAAAIPFCKPAVEIDPQFAVIHAPLSILYGSTALLQAPNPDTAVGKCMGSKFSPSYWQKME